MTQIPQDIIELIVDEVALQNNKCSALKSLALVSKGFLQASQRRLFSRIEFGGSGIQNETLFQNALLSTPTLARYIHEFTLNQSRYYSDKCNVTDIPLAELSGVLNVLRNVKHICLSFCQERSVINWQELPSSLQEALTRILMLPTLEGVRFVGITSIPQLLIKPLLRVSHCLTLEMAGFSTQSYDDQSGQQASISRVQNRSLKTLIIDKLKLEDVKPFVDALSSICNLKELRIWNAEGPFDDVEIATKIMHLQRNNITCIEFPLNYRVGDGVPALHIANLPNLRDLVLWPNFEEYYRNIQDADGLKTSLKILSTAQDGNCIDEILFIPQWPLFSKAVDSHLREWQDMDNLLLETRFKSLRSVAIAMPNWANRKKGELEAEISIIKGLLPGIERKGILKFE